MDEDETLKYKEDRIDSVMREIKRHCDDIEWVGQEYETHYECSFCRSEVVSKDDYECCDESIDEHNKTKGKNNE
jgi:hypothetical protein